MSTKKILNVIMVLSLLAGVLAACTPKADTDVLYVNLTWHQHQPLYYKDADGNYSRPWVRVHATKDYLDMAETVAKYDDVNITFNLTPSLIRQLDDFALNGVKDVYWVLAEKPAAQLTDANKTFILQRFFDANWDHIIRVYPRYSELLDKRNGTDDAAIQAAVGNFSEQDFRDLQVWFNLAWVDPDYLAIDPLKGLVSKGENFSEEDKVVLFTEILKLVQQVIPTHAELQKDKVIEVTTTPYAHPILPLIYNTDLALVGNPSAEMPEKFSYPDDATYHLAKSVEMYEEHFDQKVRGLWPGEGSVAQDIVGLVADAGYQWMQTGEPVLAKSLGFDTFTRDGNELVQKADELYRPYYVTDESGNKVAIFFRDWTLSDKIGFTYSGMSGDAAAADLIARLEAVQTKLVSEGSAGPHIVTLVIDGENAWENYDNDGKLFLNTLYKLFSESTKLKTITPSNYLKLFPEQRELPDLFPGAWFSANYDTWIGETEEALAWNYLGEVRSFLAEYQSPTRTIDAEALAKAMDFMYLAEGSDWFWWYGADQDSGQDSYFDQGFRELLKSVYTSLGEPTPMFLDAAIIQPQPVSASVPLMGSGTPEVDGEGKDEAWNWAAVYAGDGALIKDFAYVLDKDNIYFKVDGDKDALAGKAVEIYLNIPRQEGRLSFGLAADGVNASNLGIIATTLVRWDPVLTNLSLYDTDGETWNLQKDNIGNASYGGSSLELQVPLAELGELVTGDDLRMVVLVSPDQVKFPAAGPMQVVILAMGDATSVLLIEDPEGDDDGPGTYTYPTDGVFTYQGFDIKSFEVSYDATSLIFTMKLYGKIGNGWGSKFGFSVQTFDVYIDKDPGSGTGARLLLPGRNATLVQGNGWDYAAWVEGWYPQVVVPDPVTLEPVDYTEASSGMKLFVDPGKNAIIARIPISFLGGGVIQAEWSYAAVLLGQEGYPATGVWRVRDVAQKAEAYKFGGAPADNNHTRIIDIAWPADAAQTQAEILSGYTSSINSADTLGADDFAVIPLLPIE